MIKISDTAIDIALEETIRAHERRVLYKFHSGVERKVNREKHLLSEYINSGIKYLKRVEGKEGQLIRAGYRSGAHLTFRMIESQSKIDQRKSPDITEEDIKRANKNKNIFIEMEVDDVIMAKIAQIQKENEEFGDYVITYIQHQAPDVITARGFALGVITTYSAYEQAYARKNDK